MLACTLLQVFQGM